MRGNAVCGSGSPISRITHPTVFSRAQYKVPMIAHQMVCEYLAGIAIQTFCQNSLEGIEIGILLKDDCLGIASIEGMLNAVPFIGSLGSGHSWRLTQLKSQNNDS